VRADKSLRWLFEEFLKARIASDRVPFPAMFQVVDGDAVALAVDRAWHGKQMIEQRDSAIVFSHASANQRENRLRYGSVECILRF